MNSKTHKSNNTESINVDLLYPYFMKILRVATTKERYERYRKLYLAHRLKGYPCILLKSSSRKVLKIQQVTRNGKTFRQGYWESLPREIVKQPKGKETKGYSSATYDSKLYNKYKIFFKDESVKTSFKNYKELLKKKTPVLQDKYLSPLEAFCLYHYSTFRGYGEVNNAIKNHTQNETTRQFQLLLTRILRKIPRYIGVAYRGTSLNKHTMELLKYKIKNNIEYIPNKFLSSSPDSKNAERYLFNKKNQKEGYVHALFISSKNGRDISLYRIHPEKTEVLFEPFSRFKILDIQPNEGYYEISIEEL